MSKGNRSISNRDKIAGPVSVLEERKTRLMEEGSSKVKKEPAWEKEYDSLILGDGPKGTYSMDPEVSQVNNNVLVIAGTGGGKTKSVVEANLLHAYHQSPPAGPVRPPAQKQGVRCQGAGPGPSGAVGRGVRPHAAPQG